MVRLLTTPAGLVLRPKAQVIVPPGAAEAESSSSVAPTLGTLTLVHAVPFQDRMIAAVGPLAVVLWPAAGPFPGPVTVTDNSRREAGFGTRCQPRPPIQFSVTALPLGPMPTAQASAWPMTASPVKPAPLAGTGTVAQAVPFQWAV